MTTIAPIAQAEDVVSVSDPVTSHDRPRRSVIYVDVQPSVSIENVQQRRPTCSNTTDTLEANGSEAALSGDPFTAPPELAGPAEALGLVVALGVLVVTFGSLLAAGMPILTALLGVGISVAACSSLSASQRSRRPTLTLALMLGPRGRHRLRAVPRLPHRQRARRRSGPGDAAARAVAPRGSAVVFAGVTVVIALAAPHGHRHPVPAPRWVWPPPPPSASRSSSHHAAARDAGLRRRADLRPRGRAKRQSRALARGSQPLGPVRHHPPDRHAAGQRGRAAHHRDPRAEPAPRPAGRRP